MATAKRKTTTAKSPRKTTSTKAPPKKSTTQSTQSREEKLAAQALKFVDEAATLLRSGVETGAKQAAKSRVSAAKRAHSLLTKATGHLDNALADTTSKLQKVIKKLER